MNILQLQDNLKNFSEDQLVNEMRMPSGNAPQYLVLSEINRRKRVKSDYQAAEAADPSTVAEDAVASAGVPASGIMGMAQAMAPRSESSLSAPKQASMPMNEGGIINAQQGTYFPSNPELLGIYGQESGFGKNLFGSSGEVGPYQIRPTTAISPGYGIQSMFPELAQAVAQGKYKNFQEAYEDNKEMVDKALMSGEKSEAFVTDYLNKAESNLGSREKALLAYNQGIAGTKDFKGDASETDYVSGVKNKSTMYDETPMNSGIMSAEASTLNTGEGDDGNIFTKKIPFSEYFDPIGPLYRFGRDTMGPAISEFYDDYIKGASKGGKEKNILRAIEGPATKKYLDQQEKMELGAMSESDMDYSEPKTFLDTIKEAVSGSDEETQREKDIREANIKSGEVDQSPDAGIVAGGIEAKPVTPSGEAREKAEKKTLTLDEQLVAMQEDLAKNREQDKWLAIAQAGLSIMTSDKPTLGQAIGEGAGAGLQAYRDAQERYQEGVIDLLNARSKLAKNKNTFTKKDALSAINSYNTQISKLMTEREGVFNEDDKEKINQKIRNLEFQKSQLLPFAGIIGRETTTKAEYMGA